MAQAFVVFRTAPLRDAVEDRLSPIAADVSNVSADTDQAQHLESASICEGARLGLMHRQGA